MGCSDCGKPVPGVKPPPIKLSVAGFDAHAGMGLKPVSTPWRTVLRLPAFEMFAAEQLSGVLPAPAEQTDELYLRYCAWHAAKGQWPNETPLGEVIENGLHSPVRMEV